MSTVLSAFKVRSIGLVVLISLVVLAGCGGASSGSNTGGSSGSTNNSSIHLTIGGKLDTEAQILTSLYAQVLEHAGFKVTEKAKLGTNDIVFNAITSGSIDLYPEFTATGLARLSDKTSHNVNQDYQTVKSGYEQKYKITWLDLSPLNDTYGICTTKANATRYNVTKVSDLASQASKLTIATPPDGKSDPNVLPGLKPTYGFDFGTTRVLDAAVTYQAVMSGQAQFNICYTTSALITKDNFVLLQDDKNLFPIYQVAPIIRQDTLSKSPAIATTLNKLAPYLTSSVSSQLQLQVINGATPHDVAEQFLQSKGLI
ncbi:MAG: glycine/betaine ABC transporter substrate-binding protein [Ktedonobacteraceae bacterium]|nr:glycine/betaine ABC transporter substrate-binding protein [Ktedonobacteraceae bacterium]